MVNPLPVTGVRLSTSGQTGGAQQFFLALLIGHTRMHVVLLVASVQASASGV
jgi:hypothetical protein